MATATTAQPMSATSGLWKIRAVQLASERQLIGTARQIGRNERGDEVWSVPSRTHAYEAHIVTHDYTRHALHCDCPSRVACSHQGAVLHALRLREQAYRQAGQSEGSRYWAHGGNDW